MFWCVGTMLYSGIQAYSCQLSVARYCPQCDGLYCARRHLWQWLTYRIVVKLRIDLCLWYDARHFVGWLHSCYQVIRHYCDIFQSFIAFVYRMYEWKYNENWYLSVCVFHLQNDFVDFTKILYRVLTLKVFVAARSCLLNVDLSYEKIGSDCIDFSQERVILQNSAHESKCKFYENLQPLLARLYVWQIFDKRKTNVHPCLQKTSRAVTYTNTLRTHLGSVCTPKWRTPFHLCCFLHLFLPRRV